MSDKRIYNRLMFATQMTFGALLGFTAGITFPWLPYIGATVPEPIPIYSAALILTWMLSFSLHWTYYQIKDYLDTPSALGPDEIDSERST